MKEQFEEVKVEILLFDHADVIAVSCGDRPIVTDPDQGEWDRL